jgi:hypothetical protein
MDKYICLICNKEFTTLFNLNRHKNKKNKCNNIKKEYNCKLCNKEFKYKSKLIEHEQTKKHINNLHSQINGNHNQIQNNINGDNILNNYIQLTLNVNSFKKTDNTYIRQSLINDIGENIYLEIINNNDLSNLDKVKKLFNCVIDILEKLHFNLDIEENHNLKILLIFPGIKKTVYEYLILDINPDTKNIVWNSLTYEEIIEKILFHLYNLNKKYENENYDKFILFLEKNLIKNKEIANELKPFIQTKLSEMYIDFNKKQKKENREIKNDLEDKVNEYCTYRKQECKLTNGFTPEIINSSF